jgi:uncharacterized protein (TIGR02594 family)
MAASAFYGGTITSLGGAFAAIGTAATGGFWGGVLAGAVGGSIAGGVNAALGGGDLGDIFKGAFIGGIQGAASAGIGHGSWLSAGTLGNSGSAIAQTAAHGILGGAVNEAMGGKFQDGFLSAAAAKGATFMPGLGQFLDPNSGQGNILSRTALAATIGGTASALGGGKFANGAYTAAMQHLFNEEMRAIKATVYGLRAELSAGWYSKTPWMNEANSNYGISEDPDGWNLKIKGWQLGTGVKGIFTDDGDGNAWCAAFCDAMLKPFGYRGPEAIDRVRAKEWSEWGKESSSPGFGSIGIRVEKGAYHVGFVAGATLDGKGVILLGGNQGNAVNYTQFSRSSFVAFRYPSNYTGPQITRIFSKSELGYVRGSGNTR